MTAKIRVSLVFDFDLEPEYYPGCTTYQQMYNKEVENIENDPEVIIEQLNNEGELEFEFLPDETEI